MSFCDKSELGKITTPPPSQSCNDFKCPERLWHHYNIIRFLLIFYQWLSKNVAHKTSRSMLHVNYLWDMQCVSSWWTLDWLRYLHDVCYDMWFTSKVWLMWCAVYFICIDRRGQVWAMVVCPFRALVVLYRMLLIFTWYEMSNVWAIVSTIVHFPRTFLPTDFL